MKSTEKQQLIKCFEKAKLLMPSKDKWRHETQGPSSFHYCTETALSSFTVTSIYNFQLRRKLIKIFTEVNSIYSCNLAQWNDSHTYEEVIEGFDKAINYVKDLS